MLLVKAATAYTTFYIWTDIAIDSIKTWLKAWTIVSMSPWEKAGPAPFLLLPSVCHKHTTKMYYDSSKYRFVIDCFTSGCSCKDIYRHSTQLNRMIVNSISKHPAGVRAENIIYFIQTANIDTFPEKPAKLTVPSLLPSSNERNAENSREMPLIETTPLLKNQYFKNIYVVSQSS